MKVPAPVPGLKFSGSDGGSREFMFIVDDVANGQVYYRKWRVPPKHRPDERDFMGAFRCDRADWPLEAEQIRTEEYWDSLPTRSVPQTLSKEKT